ncbi:MAG: nucleotidyltransferase domain-containing protein [Nitrospirota bacterium]
MPIEGEAAVSLAAKGIFTESEKDALIKLMSDLRVSWPNAKFKLFGSKVKGLADEESDLDLLVLLPCDVSEDIRRQIIHKVFDVNLAFGTNISTLIMSEKEWESDIFSLLPIHSFIEEEGIPL